MLAVKLELINRIKYLYPKFVSNNHLSDGSITYLNYIERSAKKILGVGKKCRNNKY